jgi:hypothetical protein
LDLHSLSQRYDAQRHFWAREIALLLSKRSYRTMMRVLRQLVACGREANFRDVANFLPSQKGTQHSLETYADRVLKELTTHGLLKRTKRQQTYWYLPTELGELVLDYLPAEKEALLPSPSNNGPTTDAVSSVPDLIEAVVLAPEEA